MRFWLVLSGVGGAVCGIIIGLLLSRLGEPIALVAVLATFASSIVGWCITLRKISSEERISIEKQKEESLRWSEEHELEKEKFRAELTLKYKLKIARDLHEKFIQVWNSVIEYARNIYLEGLEATTRSGYILSSIRSIAEQIQVAVAFLEEDEAGRIMNGGAELSAIVDALDKQAWTESRNNAQSMSDLSKRSQKFSEWLSSASTGPVGDAFDCLADVLTLKSPPSTPE